MRSTFAENYRKENYMVNVELLKTKIDESGITITALADKMGVSRETFYNRLESPDAFKLSEVIGLSKALNLPSKDVRQIFFKY